MNLTLTRRHFIAAVPLTTASLMAACSPKTESAPVAAEQMPATPTPPAPVPTPAPTPMPTPASGPMAALPMLDEADTQAKSLGYVADAARLDRTRFAAIAAGSRCGNCALFRGTASDAAGPCQLFPGRSVAAAGVCSAWAKKA
jgi:hypothetical protein